ncbi:hypothetical protein KGY79_13315 [Candidatus Bipolaricaulota bacterium]|nr:hypothetical protein [Candidatus Bipolaricaulota bacterium]
MLNLLLIESSLAEKWGDYLALDQKIREKREDLVLNYRYWLSRGKFLSLIWSGRELEGEELKELSRDYAQDPDILSPAFWAFIFREKTENQLDFLRRTNVLMQENDELMGWAVKEVCDLGVEAEIYHYLSNKAEHNQDAILDSVLKRVNEYYEDLNRERLVELIKILGGEKSFNWKTEDSLLRIPETNQKELFESVKGEMDSDHYKENRVNYSLLGDQFHRFLHEEKDLRWARGRLARNGLIGYVLRRNDDDFEGQGAKETTPPQILIPEPETFKTFINDFLHFLNPQFYQAITPYLYVGYWLQFLLQEFLIKDHQKEEALGELEKLKNEYEKFYRRRCPDPRIMEAFDDWPGVEES